MAIILLKGVFLKQSLYQEVHYDNLASCTTALDTDTIVAVKSYNDNPTRLRVLLTSNGQEYFSNGQSVINLGACPLQLHSLSEPWAAAVRRSAVLSASKPSHGVGSVLVLTGGHVLTVQEGIEKIFPSVK